MNDTHIHLPAGEVKGTAVDGILKFLGVPYAAPPTGKARFSLPRPVKPWSGVRDATAPGPVAPQRIRPFPALDVMPLVGQGVPQGDDHLTVNIWTPQNAAGNPVMVFIHGGGFVLGSKDAPVQDATMLARSDIVVASINYRLGVEGFLPIPGVPTNLGLRDMIAALKWVQDNITAFGGDPANVTVFGESAGAMAIANLVASPLAQGLFRRAIVQSGHGSMVRPIPVAQRLVRKMARLLKVTPDEAGFRATNPMEAASTIEKLAGPWKIDLRDDEGFEPVFGISRFIPVYGDDVLPQHPLDALRAGIGADVELLIGTNSEEMRLYFVPTGVSDKIPGLFARWLVGRSMPKAREALAAYGWDQKGRKPGHVMTEALSDLVFRWPARQFAAAHRGSTHMYEFDWRSPACDGKLGACHGIEMPFVFDTLVTVTGPRGLVGEAPPQDLADRVHRLWVRFAIDGSVPWDPFDVDTRKLRQLWAGSTVSPSSLRALYGYTFLSSSLPAKQPCRVRHRWSSGYRLLRGARVG